MILSLRLHFAGDNKISENPTILLKNKAHFLAGSLLSALTWVFLAKHIPTLRKIVICQEWFKYFKEIMKVVLDSIRTLIRRKKTIWTVSLNVKDTKVKDDTVKGQERLWVY